jgi:hypothetical protein
MGQFRERKGSASASAAVVVAVIMLTGCTQPAPVTSSYRAAPARTPEPAAGANGSFSSPGVAGEGSFPRSFLIPGTDTSIRLGG